MIAQKEKQLVTRHVCFCELCVPSFDSVPLPVAKDERDEKTAPDEKPEAVTALAA